MSTNPYSALREAILAEVRDWLRRLRVPGSNIDGAIEWANLPPGSYTPAPGGGGTIDGGGDLSLDDLASALSEILVAGTNITITYDDAAGTIAIAATGGGGVPIPPDVYTYVTYGGVYVTYQGNYVYHMVS
jgi:hypothetical protein